MKLISEILIVDDNIDLLELLSRQLKGKGLVPTTSNNVMDAIDLIEHQAVDLLISDIKMSKIGGEQLIRYVSEHYPDLPILVMTGYPDVNSAVELMKMGVSEYLIKPFPAEDLLSAIMRIGSVEIREPEEEKLVDYSAGFPGIIGSSPKMIELFRTMEKTLNNKATVLINGESGTGKELIARAIHYESKFSSAPFVPVNCGAIPEQLIESELFGHLKGSFTGAIGDRKGFFESADGGTIFLDEITNTSLGVQAKLLRVLQEKEITPVGSSQSKKVDVRIISATNLDIKSLVSQGKFREDLFYRLNVISLNIPALRQRDGDVIKLINYFSAKFSKEHGLPIPKFEKVVLNTLENYAWPGNVRELENFIHRLVILAGNKVSMSDVPTYMKMTFDINSPENEFVSLEEHQLKYIKRVLKSTGNNKSKAADILKIDRKTLRNKLKDMG
ncbi:sigma-54-dependent transcriptional regulator [Parvicella tangerina]|uniref:Regulatory protein AtoC n=1 Tax=Parvicella tangerina TaxID=2829795 RepID=A0A916JM79_9FLAO|nr:sigma-54 dependent transcriptional regulator [Parvicella tangerina]CAG5080464.1 Regulatory protein AtoC [Parvicella tangerina]